MRQKDIFVHEAPIATAFISIGVVFCMIFALFGIKIWWFKHRLTFNQNDNNNNNNNSNIGPTTTTTTNGNTNRTQLSTRTKLNTKDKRLILQFQEQDAFQGTFRKRPEDELDVLPNRKLPPIRIKEYSQSAPSLVLPTRPPRRNKPQLKPMENFYISNPPTRIPPHPTLDAITTTNQTNSKESKARTEIFEEMTPNFRKMEINDKKTNIHPHIELTDEEHIILKAKPPKRLKRSTSEGRVTSLNLLRTKMFFETEQIRKFERCSMSVVPNEAVADSTFNKKKQEKIDQLHQRVPGDYIKYDELDLESFDAFHSKWPTNENATKQNITSEPKESLDLSLTEHLQKEKQFWLENERTHNLLDGKQNQSDAVDQIDAKRATLKRQTSLFEWNDNFIQELNWKIHDTHESEQFQTTFDFKPPFDELPSATSCVVGYEEEFDSNYEEKPTTTTKLQRQSAFEESDQLLWHDTLDKNTKIIDDKVADDTDLWLQLEKDVENFDEKSIEAEFDKIRNSYEENEAHFLESPIIENKSTSVIETKTISPNGFGKTIDEDWENFENFEKHTKVPKFAEFNNEEPKIKTILKTHSIDEDINLDAIESSSRNEDLNEIAQQTKIATDLAGLTTNATEETTSTVVVLQQPKPKPKKPRVTFDSKTEEYYLPPDHHEQFFIDDYYDDDDSVSPSPSPSPILPPTPMQRTTNTRYTFDDYDYVSPPEPTTLPPVLSYNVEDDDDDDDDEDDGENDNGSRILEKQTFTKKDWETGVCRIEMPTNFPKPAKRQIHLSSHSSDKRILEKNEQNSQNS